MTLNEAINIVEKAWDEKDYDCRDDVYNELAKLLPEWNLTIWWDDDMVIDFVEEMQRNFVGHKITMIKYEVINICQVSGVVIAYQID